MRFVTAVLWMLGTIALGMSLGGTLPNVAADWPQWRGPQRTGYVDAGPLRTELPTEGLEPVWKFDSLAGGTSGGWSSPVVVGDRVFVYAHTKVKNSDADLGEAKFPWLSPDKRTMSDAEYQEYETKRRDENERRAKAYSFSQRLLCLSLSSGEVVWDKIEETVYTRFTQSSTPCVAGGKVFLLTPARTAKCYDASTGEVLWSQPLPGKFRDEFFASSFVVDGDTAIVCCGPVFALSTDDGHVLWTGDTDAEYQSHSSPLIWKAKQGSVVIANTSGGRTQAYRAKDGSKLWEIKTGVGSSTPILAGDRLLTYGSSRKSGLTAYTLDASQIEKTPSQVWQFQRAADSGTTPVVRGDEVFVQGEKRVAKINLNDGKAVWQTTLRISTPKYTSLIGAGEQLFFGWEGILAIDANGDKFSQLYDAEIDSRGRLIRGEDLRKLLELDKVASEEDGLSKSEALWQREAVKSGPLGCCTPAFSNGHLVVRLRDSLVCYDLRRQ
ncbi:PQQ-binding-like beta-propeller repeat protein [Planctomycetes bacterium K23_9]|uniref:Outer membrane biogenesis protein BamB n=1 Tax=Stieleria marina TaxID=1930275 RepID=A0A517NX69_9BACT|nr:outer membrane biogenesis protein BamB [Planctomycetes bacterium K23_9]